MGVALLVNGLTGCTAEEISAVQPGFIKASGITAALTPGRNNGFYNMFKLMCQQAEACIVQQALDDNEQGINLSASSKYTMPSSSKRTRIIVSGKVHRVYYRESTRLFASNVV